MSACAPEVLFATDEGVRESWVGLNKLDYTNTERMMSNGNSKSE